MCIYVRGVRVPSFFLQAGACIVNADGHIVGLGYRTAPDGLVRQDAAADDAAAAM